MLTQVATATSTETYKSLAIFSQAFRNIRESYPKPISEEKLIEAAIEGMAKSLDPYSGYMNRNQYQEILSDVKGEFWGIGIEFTYEDGKIKIITAIDGTPAHKAGLRPGDIILAINDKPIAGWTLEEVAEELKGRKKGKAILVLQRDLKEFSVTLEYTNITPNPVRHEIIDNVGYLRISNFYTGTTNQYVETALTHFEKQKTKGLILDIRNNPGGLLDPAIQVANTFLTEGLIVSIQSKNPKDIVRHYARAGYKANITPLIILVNEGTASSAEIMAGALQDHQRAVLMGSKTYGKGSVQTLLPLQNNQSALRLTTATYITPGGHQIDGQGITPDVVVNFDTNISAKDPLKLQAIGLIKMLNTFNGKDTKPKQEKATHVAKDLKARKSKKAF
jgi:carboxyl-terminal processing protease